MLTAAGSTAELSGEARHSGEAGSRVALWAPCWGRQAPLHLWFWNPLLSEGRCLRLC